MTGPGANELTSDRFEVQSQIGSGTTGQVYRVYDRKLDSVVALKTLDRSDPAAIYRFKKEFRALADVHHPNLVQLYELLSENDRWFFTMELVDGLDFIDFARAQPASGPYETGRFYSLPTPTAPFDPERLLVILRQLAEGLTALHEAGKLHCDIKPSNILVTPDGRVVLLDFGLVKELYAGPVYETVEGEIMGTPAYMSPEQAAGQRVTEASDWYGVGVVLYEALTGRLPYEGGYLRVLTDKQRHDPPPPQEIVAETPAELSQVCMRLLARQPEERPVGRRILSLLGSDAEVPQTRRTFGSSSVLGGRLVGREKEVRKLGEHLGRCREGRAVVVFVRGPAGIGKSVLIRYFLELARQEHSDAVLLSGRCYESETVPYKALDALIDSLSRYLRQLTDEEVEILLPTNVLALAKLFPTLRRVQAIVGARRRVLELPDSREQRRRAFAALREMLERVAEHRTLLLAIDDVQWGDLDSAAILSEILRPPDPPPLMLIASYRDEERDASPFLEAFPGAELAGSSTEIHEISLSELSAGAARELALELLGHSSALAEALAETIARESEGSPFFIDEMVRYSKTSAAFDEDGESTTLSSVERALTSKLSLERLLAARLEHLPQEARRLLEVVAVAGRPVDLEAARQAAELGGESQAALTTLRGASLIRLRGMREHDQIEPYHSRVQQAALAGLDAQALARIHHRLALALESSGRADPETLALHFQAAGEAERAADFAIAAADKAREALAFERAAGLYRFALELDVRTAEDLRRLRRDLGDALTNAGRCAAAADAYLSAAEGAKTAAALELRRRAAEQLLISGHLERGLEILRSVLLSVDMGFPETPQRAVASLLWWWARLRLRGLEFEERDSTQIAAETLIRIDTCWSVAIGLGTVDPIRGIAFSKQHLLLALEAGEPYRIARALAIEAACAATGGSRSQSRTTRLIEASMQLAERVNRPHASGLAHVIAGMAAYLGGHWKKACELLDRGETILREGCTGVTWELDTAMSYRFRALIFAGRLDKVQQRLPAYLKEVREKGGRYAEVNLRSRISWLPLLAADRPEEALEEVHQALERWPESGFHVQHYWLLTGEAEIALYRGDPAAAWEHVQRTWPKMERSLLLRIQLTRNEARVLRSRTALAAALGCGQETARGRELLRLVAGDLRRVEREKLFWATPLALLLRAGLATARGDQRAAIEHLVAAAAGFESADMELHAAVSRRRRGQLELARVGDGSFILEAESWMAEQGIENPERMSAVLAPGVWG